MPNKQMIDSWNRSQAQYAQARYYTPGHQRTQYRTTERGRPAPMNLFVVVHNDAPITDPGLQRVDVMVNSGSHDRAAQHANAHLVNAYDADAGITDHTALYADTDMTRIHRAAGGSVELADRDGGGPPGAMVYSVQAQLRTNDRGELVIDTAAPMQAGSGASHYSLHDVQLGMERAAQRDLGLEAAPSTEAPKQGMTREAYIARQRELMPDLDHSNSPGRTPAAASVQGVLHRANSQAGLAAARGPVRSVPSSPAPGQPGSRFNPNVVERRPRQQAAPSAGLITSADVPRAAPGKGQERQERKDTRKAEAQLDRRMSVDGIKGGVQGAKLGAKAGSVVPGVGTAAAGAIGAGVGASASMSKTAIEAGDAKCAFRAATPLGGVVGGAVAAKLASDQRKRLDGQSGQQAQDSPAGPTGPSGTAGGKPTAADRFKESKVGQAVQSEEFRAGAKRVGAETARHAAMGADRAKKLGADAKGVAAGAAKGAASGFVQGVRAEMTGRDGSKSTAAGMFSGMGRAVASNKLNQANQAPAKTPSVHENYHYQFEDDKPRGGEPELG